VSKSVGFGLIMAVLVGLFGELLKPKPKPPPHDDLVQAKKKADEMYLQEHGMLPYSDWVLSDLEIDDKKMMRNDLKRIDEEAERAKKRLDEEAERAKKELDRMFFEEHGYFPNDPQHQKTMRNDLSSPEEEP